MLRMRVCGQDICWACLTFSDDIPRARACGEDNFTYACMWWRYLMGSFDSCWGYLTYARMWWGYFHSCAYVVRIFDMQFLFFGEDIFAYARRMSGHLMGNFNFWWGYSAYARMCRGYFEVCAYVVGIFDRQSCFLVRTFHVCAHVVRIFSRMRVCDDIWWAVWIVRWGHFAYARLWWGYLGGSFNFWWGYARASALVVRIFGGQF